MFLNWLTISPADKLSLVQRLASARLTADRYWLKKSKERKPKVGSKATAKRQKRPPVIAFKSEEARRMFDTLPPEMKAWLKEQ
jgi:hypothetical protein